MKLFTSLEFWNFVIAFSALSLALYSIYYTRKKDAHSIEITNAYISLVESRPALIMFNVVNTSNSVIRIENVELFAMDGKQFEHMNYKPKPKTTYTGAGHFKIPVPELIHPYEYASPFNDSEVLPPFEKLELRYYLNPYSHVIKIKVTCNRPIHRFRKNKSFTIHLKEFD